MSKYFTLSFDDGLEQDKKILEILRSFGLNCATFNINSGLFGHPQAIGRIGNMGMLEKPLIYSQLPKSRLYKFHYQCRIPADEVPQVYADVEVACHGLTHRPLLGVKEAEARKEILDDRKNLEECLGRPIQGFIFAKGFADKTAHRIVREAGFTYTRGIQSTKSYAVPQDFLTLQPTLWQGSKHLDQLLDLFLKDPTQDDCLFYVWGHGYELDYGTDRCSYERLKRLLDNVAGRNDIICCSNSEAVSKLTNNRQIHTGNSML